MELSALSGVLSRVGRGCRVVQTFGRSKKMFLVLAFLSIGGSPALAANVWPAVEITVPIAEGKSLLGWRAWFWSQPGGPLDVPNFTAPGDWRDFQTPAALSRLWSDASFSDLLIGADGIERLAYLHEGRVYLAQRTASRSGAAWRHELVGEAGVEWGNLSLARGPRGRIHLAFEAVDAGGRRLTYAVREPYGYWTLETVPASAAARRARLVIDDAAVPHLMMTVNGTVQHLWKDGANWHQDAPSDNEIGGEEFPAATRGSDDALLAAWVGSRGRLVFGRRGPSGWTVETVARAAEQPAFMASPEGGLAISFKDARAGTWRLARPGGALPVGAAQAHARNARWPWAPLLPAAVLLGRWLVVLRRARARRSMRAEAALIGGSMRFDVVARDPRASSLRPLAPALVAVTSRSPVLWMQGLRPGEAWLGPGWTVSPGRAGWVEVRCGGVVLELAPEPGMRPWGSAREAERLFGVLRAARRIVREEPKEFA